jgi:hypothetical protein
MAGRGGVMRYSSILGSLTIFGSINGYAFILLFSNIISKNIIIKLIMFLIIVSSTFVSMQKSAAAMMIISFLTLFIFNRIYLKKKIGLKKIIFATLFILCLVALIKTNLTLERYYNANMTVTFGENILFVDSSEVLKDTELTYEAIIARLYGFTLGSINHYGYSSIILGVGLVGGAGTMGMSGGIAHSTFGDLLMMGGVVYVLLFLMLYAKVQLYLYRDKLNSLSGTFFMCNILLLVNMFATSGATIQPSISIVFWLSVAYVARKSKYVKYFLNRV